MKTMNHPGAEEASGQPVKQIFASSVWEAVFELAYFRDRGVTRFEFLFGNSRPCGRFQSFLEESFEPKHFYSRTASTINVTLLN